MDYIKKISEEEILILSRYKDKPLMNNSRLCYLVDYEFQKKTIDWFFTTQTVYYLTKYKVEYYNILEKQIYTMDDNQAINWLPISSIVYSNSTTPGIIKCRENYLTFKESFEGFGHKIISDSELKAKENE